MVGPPALPAGEWLSSWGSFCGPGLRPPTSAGAQEVSVRAYLSPSTVGVGQVFVLNVEVTGAQDVDSEPQLPDLAAFATYLGSGTSTSMQMVNGRTTVSLTIQYRYQALQEGTFEIPAFTVSVGGRSYSTEPFTLTVSAGHPPILAKGTAPGPRPSSGPRTSSSRRKPASPGPGG